MEKASVFVRLDALQKDALQKDALQKELSMDKWLLFLSLLGAGCWTKTTLVTVRLVLCPAQHACTGPFSCAGHQNGAVNLGPNKGPKCVKGQIICTILVSCTAKLH